MIYRTGTLYLLPLSRGGDNGQPEQIAVSPVSDAFDLSPIDTLRSLIRSSRLRLELLIRRDPEL